MSESSSDTGDRGYRAFIESEDVPDSVTWTYVNGADDWEELAYALGSELDESHALIEKYKFLCGSSFEDHFWTATCKPDGEGQCSLEIDSYEDLFKLVDSNEVEIPEYSHGEHELLLYGKYCTCGITHEEWLENKR